MPRIAVATCAEYPKLGLDGPFLLEALAAQGLEGVPVVWDDPAIDWQAFDLCLIHSTWDYHHKLEQFLAWAAQVSQLTQLWNPVGVIRWNTQKDYLRDFAAAGIPVVPTIWVKAGTTTNLEAIITAQNWQKAVIKPAVAASGYGTYLVTAASIAEGQAHLEAMAARGNVLIQPFLSTYATVGESSLIFIRGEYAHTTKRPSGLQEGATRQVWEYTLAPTVEEELALAKRVVALLTEPMLYARVDLIRDETGELFFTEVELTEPGLFLRLAPATATKLATAIKSLVASR